MGVVVDDGGTNLVESANAVVNVATQSRGEGNAMRGKARQKQKTKERTVTTSANSIRDAAGIAPERWLLGEGERGWRRMRMRMRMRMRKWKWKGERESV